MPGRHRGGGWVRARGPALVDHPVGRLTAPAGAGGAGRYRADRAQPPAASRPRPASCCSSTPSRCGCCAPTWNATSRSWRPVPSGGAREEERISIAVNADSIATWALPALNDLALPGPANGDHHRRPGFHPGVAARRPGAGLRHHAQAGPARLQGGAAGRDELRGGRQARATPARPLPPGPVAAQLPGHALHRVQPQGRHAERIRRQGVRASSALRSASCSCPARKARCVPCWPAGA